MPTGPSRQVKPRENSAATTTPIKAMRSTSWSERLSQGTSSCCPTETSAPPRAKATVRAIMSQVKLLTMISARIGRAM